MTTTQKALAYDNLNRDNNMSTLKLYQMYDTVAMQMFGLIIAATRDEAVIRQFTDVLARPETMPGQYPEDFALMTIGEQNQDTGELTPRDPQIIFTGRVWKRLQQLKVDSSSPANSNNAGEQPPTLLSNDTTVLHDLNEERKRNLELRQRLTR